MCFLFEIKIAEKIVALHQLFERRTGTNIVSVSSI